MFCKMKIMFDVDGVLADFVLGFRRLANETYKLPLYGTHEQPDWKFPDLDYQQNNRLWERVKDPKEKFWTTLFPLISSRLFQRIDDLQTRAEVYFITTRVGIDAQDQTAQWLQEWGLVRPSVIIAGDKGPICRAIGIRAGIDDKYDNVVAMDLANPEMGAWLLSRPYNTKYEWKQRVNEVDVFLDFVEEAIRKEG